MKLNDVLALPDHAYVAEQDLAEALGMKAATLRWQAARRKGPPRTVAGHFISYRVGAFRRWLLEHERDFADARSKRRKTAAVAA